MSLSSLKIDQTDIKIADGPSGVIVTLGQTAAQIWTDLQARSKDIVKAVKSLQKMKRSKTTGGVGSAKADCNEEYCSDIDDEEGTWKV